MQVVIKYNPYRCKTQILINNNPISNHSKLSKYTSEPFNVWCNDILDLVYEETNEEFKLKFISRDLEANIMKDIANNYRFCRDIVIEEPMINYPLSKRVDIIKNICKNLGLDEYKQLYNNKLNVYFYNLDITNFEKKILEDNSNEIYNDIELKRIHKFDDINVDNLKNSIIVLKVENEQDIYKIYNYINNKSEGFNFDNLLVITEKLDLQTLKDNTYKKLKKYGVKFSNTENIITCNNLINEIFIQNILTPKLVYITETIKEKVNVDLISIATMFEPEIRLKTNNQIEKECLSEFIVESVPKGYNIDVGYIINDDYIISIENGNVKALNDGKTKLTVYLKDNPYIKDSIDIEVYSVIRAKEVELYFEKNILVEGETLETDISYKPYNAENIDNLKVESSNTNIIQIDNNNNIKSINSGECSVIVSIDNIYKEYKFTVKKEATNIIVDSQYINLKVGDTHKIEAKVHPLDSIDNEIVIYSDNPEIVEVNGKTLKANRFGEAKIIVTTDRKNIKEVIDVKVESTLYKARKPNIFPKETLITSIFMILGLFFNYIYGFISELFYSIGLNLYYINDVIWNTVGVPLLVIVYSVAVCIISILNIKKINKHKGKSNSTLLIITLINILILIYINIYFRY